MSLESHLKYSFPSLPTIKTIATIADTTKKVSITISSLLFCCKGKQFTAKTNPYSLETLYFYPLKQNTMETTEKKLFLLDAYALIYRAFFALSKNPRMNSKGVNTSAVMGFLNSLYEILQKEKPSHIGVAFDVSGTAQRQAEYSEYKANREKMPDDLRDSIPYIIRLIEGFNIPVYGVEGYEADDVIGTLSKKVDQQR